MLYTDVAVIGAGVIGCSIARELSRYDIRCVLLEKRSDVAEGTSKANNGIVHAGYAAAYGTLKARLNVRGSMMYPSLAEELDVPYKQIGSIVVAFTQEELRTLELELANGCKNGVHGLELIGAEQLRMMEPNINPKAIAGLYAPTAAITSPYEMTIALAENAAANGVKVLLETEVLGISRVGTGGEVRIQGELSTKADASAGGSMEENTVPRWELFTSRGKIRAHVVINAAGLFADEVAAMIGDTSFSILPRKGEYYLLDKSVGVLVNHVLFPVGTTVSKGITVTPTVDGNILLGPTADYLDDKEDVACTAEGLEKVLAGARKLVPSVPIGKTITQFAGIRATLPNEDFLIAESQAGSGFINVAGIQSPGLASAPAIAVEVVSIVTRLLEERGLKPKRKAGFNPYRQRLPRFSDLPAEEKARLIAEDPDWGVVVCRCETVTKKEVLHAIRGPVGAKTLDAVKRRTRAGMGRCQGSFCTPKIVALLAEELGIPEVEVTKFGRSSRLLMGEVKGRENR